MSADDEYDVLTDLGFPAGGNDVGGWRAYRPVCAAHHQRLDASSHVGPEPCPEWEAARPKQAQEAAPASSSPRSGSDPVQEALLLKQEMQRLRLKRRAARELDAEEAAERFAADRDKLDHRSRSLTELLAVPRSPTTYAIDDLLPIDANVTGCAGKKTGKTTMSGNLARCFADGALFLDRFAVVQSVVGIWDYEMGEQQFRDWLRDQDIRNTERVHTLALKGVAASFKAPAFREFAVEWLRSRGIEVWIIDPAHCAASGYLGAGGDPNDAVQAFTEELDRIKEEAGVRNLVVFIHTGLTGDHARGGARWGDWPDVIWTYTKDKESGVRTLSAEGRDVLLAETPLAYDRETRHLSTADFLPAGESWRPTDADRLVMWLRNNPGKHPSKRLAAAELHISQENAATAFEQAQHQNRIVIAPGPRRAQVAWLTEDWEEENRSRKTTGQSVQQAIPEA